MFSAIFESVVQKSRFVLAVKSNYRKGGTWHMNSVANPGCLSRIPDPTFYHPGSRIQPVSIPDPGSRNRIKEFKYFNPKKTQKMVYKL
jgi:hypothetical protein